MSVRPLDIPEPQPDADHVKRARFGEEKTAVLHPRGVLDYSSFQALLETAQVEIRRGARRLIIDLAGIHDISRLSGVASLHRVSDSQGNGSMPLPARLTWERHESSCGWRPSSKRMP